MFGIYKKEYHCHVIIATSPKDLEANYKAWLTNNPKAEVICTSPTATYSLVITYKK